MTLAEFLLARIAEDEAAAQAGAGRPSYSHYGDTAAEETLEMARNEGVADAGPAHFDRWLPSRVLAECEAKRRIVKIHAPTTTERSRHEGAGYRSCPTCDPFPAMESPDPGLCETLRLLALPYADHPGYREEWRP